MNADTAPASEPVRNAQGSPAIPPVRQRVVQVVAGDGLLSPLEAALVAEIRGNGSAVVVALGELKTEIREIRNNPPFRWVPWSMLLLWLLNMFVIAILAMERGVDPMHAAEAVKLLSPGLQDPAGIGGTP